MIELVELLVPAALALCVVRFILVVKVPGGAKLASPASLGMPVAGPAPPFGAASAHAALSRRGSGSRPKFRT